MRLDAKPVAALDGAHIFARPEVAEHAGFGPFERRPVDASVDRRAVVPVEDRRVLRVRIHAKSAIGQTPVCKETLNARIRPVNLSITHIFSGVA